MELFFDLVYVFAITQLSDFLFQDATFRRALEALIMFGAVWWAWNYTAWATNWLDPESIPGALLMIVLMAISLVMSAAIPEAFDGRGIPFAFAYVGLQVVRSGFMVWAFTGADDRMRRNYAQLLAWSCIAGVIWIAGAFVPADLRLWLWLARAGGRPGGAGARLLAARRRARRRWRTGRWPAGISPSAASSC